MGSEETNIQSLFQKDLETHSDRRLALLEKLRQKSVYEVISTLTPYKPTKAPYVVEIDPTTACNLSCPECISGMLLNQDSLQTQKLLETISELAEMGTKAVIFIGGGEPMAHPSFSTILRHSDAHGLRIGITTNGTMIRRHIDAVAECAFWTRVSIDAGRPETFSIFRPSRGNKHPLSGILRQMEALARVKRGKLGYSFLLLKRDEMDNIHEIAEATRIARDIGCDYIEIKPSMNADHTLIAWSKDELATIAEQLEASKSMETSTFSVLAPITLFRVLYLGAATGELKQSKDYHWCPATHYRTVITPSGCYVCPYHRGNPTKKYGDIRTQSFREIWNSDEFERVLNNTNPAEHCQFHCIRHGQNVHILQMLETSSISRAFSLQLEEDYDPFI
jgi:MoaA/NifB/PqqE/SkfB family radical SAM enzyme